MIQGVLEVYKKFRQFTMAGLPEKILHFSITEHIQALL